MYLYHGSLKPLALYLTLPSKVFLMESPTSAIAPQKALPQPPTSRYQPSKRDGQHYLPERSTARQHRVDAQADPLESNLTLEIRAVEKQNEALKMELAKNYRLQIIGEKLVEEVRISTERLRNAVLAFRKEQKSIDTEFIRENQF